ncbi:hypothetical protein AVEN_202529-1 [Araneus ventricosus]|uniref:Uncharacterized protein n=1 Tax=Araneus ventricosus TaxID=182803 RepID=A0A4Y2RBE0_ARAVE|nr:hypothetical protein AVEN_202529-1 [Araneus ventricosus]
MDENTNDELFRRPLAIGVLKWTKFSVKGRGSLVVRSRPRNRRVPVSKLDFTEDLPWFEGLLHVKSNALFGEGKRGASPGVVLVTRPRFECQPRCRPRHPTAVVVPGQVSSSSPDRGSKGRSPSKIALVLLQNGTLT